MDSKERSKENKRQEVMAKKVRDALYRQDRTRTWLINELAKAGIHTSATEMSEALRNVRHGQKVMQVLTASMVILEV